jgi:hypothetical protein
VGEQDRRPVAVVGGRVAGILAQIPRRPVLGPVLALDFDDLDVDIGELDGEVRLVDDGAGDAARPD